VPLAARLGDDLARLLRRTVVGRQKDYGRLATSRNSSVGACSFPVGYPPNAAALTSFESAASPARTRVEGKQGLSGQGHPHRAPVPTHTTEGLVLGASRAAPDMAGPWAPRQRLGAQGVAEQAGGRAGAKVHFAGSLDVCCTGRRVRCSLAPVYAASRAEPRRPAFRRVVVRPSVRPRVAEALLATASDWPLERSHSPSPPSARPAQRAQGSRAHAKPHGVEGSCVLLALQLLARRGRWNASRVRSEVARLQASSGALSYTRMGREMARASLCLVPPGDTCATSRLYSAVAAGCVPVILCDTEPAFSQAVDWDAFLVRIPPANFTRSPVATVAALAAMTAEDVAQRRAHLLRARGHILFQARGGERAADHVLEEVRRCFQAHRRESWAPWPRQPWRRLVEWWRGPPSLRAAPPFGNDARPASLVPTSPVSGGSHEYASDFHNHIGTGASHGCHDGHLGGTSSRQCVDEGRSIRRDGDGSSGAASQTMNDIIAQKHDASPGDGTARDISPLPARRWAAHELVHRIIDDIITTGGGDSLLHAHSLSGSGSAHSD